MATVNLDLIGEGDKCPETGCDGVIHLPPVEGCYCHINPPCSACTSNSLTCNRCGWEVPQYREGYTAEKAFDWSDPLPLRGWFKGYEYTIGEGKRLFEVFYDGRSGSTMEFRGRIEGEVTASEILKTLGDGTFGHRGPRIQGDRFTYTKITD